MKSLRIAKQDVLITGRVPTQQLMVAFSVLTNTRYSIHWGIMDAINVERGYEMAHLVEML